MSSTKRIAKWDNIKFFMILSVVIGHSIYGFRESSQLVKSIYLFIYTYHMPVFIFIAGLFSKRIIIEKRFEKIVDYLLIYLVMKFLDTFGYYLSGSNVKFHLFWEDGPGWFALAMAAFILCTILIQSFDRRYMMLFAIILGCLAGLDNHLGDHFASMRICVFYPVFLAGFYLDKSIFENLSAERALKYITRVVSFIFLNILLAICILKVDLLYPYISLLKGKFTYESMGLGMKGILARLICYVFWAVMILVVIMVNLDMKCVFTWIGKRTMATFIWHHFFILLIFSVFGVKHFLKINMPHYYVFATICIAAIITIITAYLPEIRIPGKPRLIPKYDPQTGEPLGKR